MKKIFLMLFLLHNAIASNSDETTLLACQLTGRTLYNTCVITPPVTPQQHETCMSLFVFYTACSKILNLPELMKKSDIPSKYTLSPYDPCKFEVQHLILEDICK